MLLNRSLAAALGAAVCTLILNTPVGAATQPSAADLAAFRNYTLTTGFLDKWKAIAQDPKAPQCNLTTLTLHANTLDGMTREYDARPGIHGYLASHGLTAREVILALSTLTAAGIQDLRETHPELAQGSTNQPVSAANMAFYREHRDELHQFMQRLAQQRLHAAGGKGPACPE
jgi:hypothetical protein